MDINYELYKVFYQVASSLSFSEASKKLFISQSAVSQSIKTLEKKLGQLLFIRSTKKVKLSPAGEMLLKHIEPAIHLIQRGESQLLDAECLGQLHIGASDTICRYFLVPYLKQFHETFPSVPIKVTNATSLKCVELIEQGKVDLIVTNYPNSRMEDASLYKTTASFQDVFIANPAYFPLEQKELSLEELNQYPILMLDKKSTTSEFLYRLFLQHQLELRPEIELSSNDFLIDLAKIGIGIAFIPDYCLTEHTADLKPLHVREEMPKRQLVAAVNPSLPISPSAREFLALLPSVEETL
ncbi:MAG: LysR family transcriptional regulator [Lachnospiraceae bacterium]|nr:LysR family transcriptional regulator [Lachnospiraceae bacterium]